MSADEYLLDDGRLRAFVATVRDWIERAGSPEEACDAVRPDFARLLADPDWLPAQYRHEAPTSGMGGGIGQWLLFRERRSLALALLPRRTARLRDARPRPPRLGNGWPLPG